MTQESSAGNAAKPLSPWKHRLHEIIFEADTRAGKAFDVALFVLIGISVVVVLLESMMQDDSSRMAATGPGYARVQPAEDVGHRAADTFDSEPAKPASVSWTISTKYKPLFTRIEWILTGLFTVEYILRILCVGRPWRYMRSFFGVVDLLAILPSYVSLFLVERPSALIVIRVLRLMRVFRVLKLAQYLTEANALVMALRRTRAKITVFFLFVMIVVLILGSLMYLVEGPEHGFSNIPKSMYWAIVTVTTVGYGDIAPVTIPGRIIAALAMLTGYSIIVVPTGIVSVEAMAASRFAISTQACPSCSSEGHDVDAQYCKYCGSHL